MLWDKGLLLHTLSTTFAPLPARATLGLAMEPESCGQVRFGPGTTNLVDAGRYQIPLPRRTFWFFQQFQDCSQFRFSGTPYIRMYCR